MGVNSFGALMVLYIVDFDSDRRKGAPKIDGEATASLRQRLVGHLNVNDGALATRRHQRV